MKVVKGLMRDLLVLTERTEVTKRAPEPEYDWERQRIKDAPYMLSIDDERGNKQQHHHDTSGHDFPMTRKELMRLRAQITALLEEADSASQK